MGQTARAVDDAVSVDTMLDVVHDSEQTRTAIGAGRGATAYIVRLEGPGVKCDMGEGG